VWYYELSVIFVSCLTVKCHLLHSLDLYEIDNKNDINVGLLL
jgi:hypothetical protein